MSSTKWYVIQTSPGAQRQHRLYVRDCGKSGNAMPKLKRQESGHLISEIEYALQEAGFVCYMPVEHKTIIHHRTKKPISRRFALLPGYAFVAGVTDFPRLEAVDGVDHILGVSGCPIPVSQAIIDDLRKAEEQVAYENERQERIRREAKKKLTRRRAATLYPVGSRIRFKHPLVGVTDGVVESITGRRAVKATLEKFAHLKPIEIGVEDIDEVVDESFAA